ncbi:hypothetical protein VTP01DRAFT_2868 [Rhizomucor pusillus]|uniref:uncharacterized protein n=1 Tax=Rhizomucor pusillus TaxID=4840 RepID=UPI0037432B90
MHRHSHTHTHTRTQLSIHKVISLRLTHSLSRTIYLSFHSFTLTFNLSYLSILSVILFLSMIWHPLQIIVL